ncbi:hypothetical protein BGZ57DRAFT_1003436 [Hyaloscypha finlandica]|nr:hypothetical protein BGZ57DRAFT_1003436 [Hyaloscypha finlandica]
MSQEESSATTSAATPSAPAPKEAIFFLAILNNMKNKPEVDWDAVAQSSGFKNGNTAATRFGQIKKKWGAMSSDADTTASGSSPSKSPKAKTPKKAKVGSGTNTSPSKVTKKRDRKSKVKHEDEAEDGGADAEMNDSPAQENFEEEAEFY